jgi:hypothetical protein
VFSSLSPGCLHCDLFRFNLVTDPLIAIREPNPFAVFTATYSKERG